MNRKSNFVHKSHRLGVFLVLLLIVCSVWYYVNPSGREMHLEMFRMSYLGFSGMNMMSFILALVQTYIWGYVFVGVWWLSGFFSPKP